MRLKSAESGCDMIQTGLCLRRAVTDHPCFYGSASARWGRVHLPVAPNCNISCNFCNRLYDCVNESRPGVTSRIFEPAEALRYLNRLFKTRADISVIGIAGPGDALCDQERTLETLRAVHAAYPDLLLCISTNGLNLTEYVDELADSGVTHVTVTVNAVDPLVGRQIYSKVTFNHQTWQGMEAAELLLSRQQEAIARLKDQDLMVKINTVVIPGVNAGHIEAIAQKAAEWGADVMNCIPMIPVANTPFENLEEPDDAEMARIRDIASFYVPQMYHCRRCRADAVGLICSGESAG
ncbi:MAG: FeMo cofactor biosynthesis protein NifB [Syntrophus sp. PtaB.Bin001]|nr:MAG: FeMo cofactor biosynthesis protein NifB [Syntrophus sp. PtaB.Bin001]